MQKNMTKLDQRLAGRGIRRKKAANPHLNDKFKLGSSTLTTKKERKRESNESGKRKKKIKESAGYLS